MRMIQAYVLEAFTFPYELNIIDNLRLKIAYFKFKHKLENPGNQILNILSFIYSGLSECLESLQIILRQADVEPFSFDHQAKKAIFLP
jgi:hypothetical protein